MAAQRNGETGIWVVQKGDTLTGIVRKAFRITDVHAIANKVNQIVRLNPHIKNPNLIHPKQVINLGRTNTVTVEPFREADLLATQNIFSENTPELDFMMDNWPVLHGVASTPGVSDTPQIHSMFPTQDAIKWGMRVAKSGLKTSTFAAKGQFGNLLKVDPHQFQSIEGQLVRAMKNNVRYIQQGDGVLGFVAKESRAFQIGGKVIMVKPSSSGGLYAFSQSVKDAKNFAKYIAKPAGTAFKFIDVGMYGYNVYQAMGTPDQNRTISKETGKFAVGFGAGLAGGAIANGACGLLTLTTGVGGVVCYLTVFVAVSYTAGKVGEAAGEFVYNTATSSTVPVYQSEVGQCLVP